MTWSSIQDTAEKQVLYLTTIGRRTGLPSERPLEFDALEVGTLVGEPGARRPLREVAGGGGDGAGVRIKEVFEGGRGRAGRARNRRRGDAQSRMMLYDSVD